MENEDGGYATTDEELDSDNDVEKDLKKWLQQLDKPVTAPKVRTSEKLNSVSCNGNSSKEPKLDQFSADLEFDSILGALSNLEQQFDFDQAEEKDDNQSRVSKTTQNSTPSSSVNNHKQPAVIQQSSMPDFSDIDLQLQGALEELTALVEATETVQDPQEVEIRADSNRDVEKSTDRISVLSKHSDDLDPRVTRNKPRRQSESARSVNSLGSQTSCGNKVPDHPQVCLRIYSPDGSIKSLLADETTTVGELCDVLLEKNHIQEECDWVLCEQLPSLYMVRQLDNSLLILNDVVRCWSKDSTNRLLFKSYTLDKYGATNNNADQELEGFLNIRAEGKKTWKKLYCALKPDGIYCYPKGKGKSDLTCVRKFGNDGDVYTALGWKKKYKSPNDFGFAIKPTKLQNKSPKDIKYFCADDEQHQFEWVVAISKYVMNKTPKNSKRTAERRGTECFTQQTLEKKGTECSTPQTLERRGTECSIPQIQHHIPAGVTTESTGSPAKERKPSSCRKESFDTGGTKKAVLPITTETTRLLSMQQTNPIKQLPNNQRRESLPCSPQPLPSHKQRRSPSPDLPPPPPELISNDSSSPSRRMSSKKGSAPPAPPKRDNTTKLSFRANEDDQTKNFILNLHRAIGQKQSHGANGLRQLEMPLPPPPVASENLSYIDLGELPPPPAELLQGLKHFRQKPLVFPKR